MGRAIIGLKAFPRKFRVRMNSCSTSYARPNNDTVSNSCRGRLLSKHWQTPSSRLRQFGETNDQYSGTATQFFEISKVPLSHSACPAPHHDQPKAPAPTLSSPPWVPGPPFSPCESLAR